MASAHGGCILAASQEPDGVAPPARHVTICSEVLMAAAEGASEKSALEQLLPSAEDNDADEQKDCKCGGQTGHLHSTPWLLAGDRAPDQALPRVGTKEHSPLMHVMRGLVSYDDHFELVQGWLP